jgi:hypothetical protein
MSALKRFATYLVLFLLGGLSSIFILNFIPGFIEYRYVLKNSDLTHDDFIDIVGNAKNTKQKIEIINKAIIDDEIGQATIALHVLKAENERTEVNMDLLNNIVENYYQKIEQLENLSEAQVRFKKEYLLFAENKLQ